MAKKEKNFEVIVKVERVGSRLKVFEIVSNEPVAEKIPYGARNYAAEQGHYLGKSVSAAGNVFWRKVQPSEVPDAYTVQKNNPGEILKDVGYIKPTDDEVRLAVANAVAKKPNTLVLDTLNWKLATRALMRGENILFLGHSGCGKTLTARTIAKVYNRPFFRFNMGAMTDARTSLIGNTHYKPESGTFFAQSDFVTAITTPGAVVLLDEVTRMSNDAENLVLTVLDKDQRYMRLDENPDVPVVEVAEGVVFFGTANIGTEYTSTRTIDRATKDRFTTIVDIPLLTEEQEFELLRLLYPDVNRQLLEGIAKVAAFTRDELNSDEPKINTLVSTRSTVEQVALLVDGFVFSEVMEAIVLPLYDKEGGVESEQAYMRSVIQGHSHLDRVPALKNAEVVAEIDDDASEADDDGDLFADNDVFTKPV